MHVCLIYQLNTIIKSNFWINIWDNLKAVNIRQNIVAYNNFYKPACWIRHIMYTSQKIITCFIIYNNLYVNNYLLLFMCFSVFKESIIAIQLELPTTHCIYMLFVLNNNYIYIVYAYINFHGKKCVQLHFSFCNHQYSVGRLFRYIYTELHPNLNNCY